TLMTAQWQRSPSGILVRVVSRRRRVEQTAATPVSPEGIPQLFLLLLERLSSFGNLAGAVLISLPRRAASPRDDDGPFPQTLCTMKRRKRTPPSTPPLSGRQLGTPPRPAAAVHLQE